MRVFFYEFVTGGGFFTVEGQPQPEGSLLTEGLAMRAAMIADLERIPDLQVITTRDVRLGLPERRNDIAISHPRQHDIHHLAAEADFALIIAPEFDFHLQNIVRVIEQTDCRLVSPPSGFIQLTTDKTLTTERLASADVPTPAGVRLDHAEGWRNFPAVLKKNDGAGSMAREVSQLPEMAESEKSVWRIEQKVKGTACSVSFLCGGDAGPIACPPMLQILSDDGQFQYQGGRRLTNASLANRATRLGLRAIAALPPTLGYVGIDLVLGDNAKGTGDYVIEVNPRITTSYIGIRRLTEVNLALCMLDIAIGKIRQVSFEDTDVYFRPDGTVS